MRENMCQYEEISVYVWKGNCSVCVWGICPCLREISECLFEMKMFEKSVYICERYLCVWGICVSVTKGYMCLIEGFMFLCGRDLNESNWWTRNQNYLCVSEKSVGLCKRNMCFWRRGTWCLFEMNLCVCVRKICVSVWDESVCLCEMNMCVCVRGICVSVWDESVCLCEINLCVCVKLICVSV